MPCASEGGMYLDDGETAGSHISTGTVPQKLEPNDSIHSQSEPAIEAQ